MSANGHRARKPRRSDVVIISVGLIVLGLIAFIVSVQIPWASAVGNSGAGLCAERAPWGTEAHPPYPGPRDVDRSRSWWPVGVTCAGPDPATGMNVVVAPDGWGPTVFAYTALTVTFVSLIALADQLRRPKL